jgi:inosine/xanthosine triphosphatase
VKVLIGSKNKVKVLAVHKAFQGVFPDESWEVEGQEVDSGVSEQPMDEEETIRGARNRAHALVKEGGADYYVGLEGGLIHSAGQWMECGWIVVLDSEGNEGISTSPKMMISDAAYEFMKAGNNLTDFCEKHFSIKDAGAKMGYFGLMTNGMVDREHAYMVAVAFALARFTHPEIFES